MTDNDLDFRVDDPPERKPRGWEKLWQIPAFVVGIICVCLAGGGIALRADPAREFERDLRAFRVDLKTEADPMKLQPAVDRLAAKAESFPKHNAQYRFLIGSYYFRRAEREPTVAEWRNLANENLSRARADGVPDADQPALLYRLGMTQYRLGVQPNQALALIKQGVEQGGENPALGYAFLADAYLKLPQPNVEAALAASQKQLEYVNDRDPEAFAAARLLHAEILQRAERRPDALRELAQIPNESSSNMNAKVLLLQATCSETEEDWAKALGFWRKLEPFASGIEGGIGRVWHRQGLAHSKTRPANNAAAVELWTKAAATGGEEGQAAALGLGSLLIAGDPEMALSVWDQALAPVRASGAYKNRYVGAAAAKESIEKGGGDLLAARDFARALRSVDLLASLAPPAVVDEKRAVIHAIWAKDLATRPTMDAAEKEKLSAEACAHYQNAGDYYAQAALSRETKDKIELYWTSATNYLAGRDHVKACLILEKFLRLAENDGRLSLGHFSLAESLLAQGRGGDARAHFHKCIELNLPPYVNRARHRLALESLKAKNLPEAREILAQIVQSNGPDRDPDLHEKSLYELGNLHFEMNEQDEGVLRLRDAIRLFPNNPAVWKARDRLADHYWECARKLVAETKDSDPLAEARRNKREQFLRDAQSAYEAIDKGLSERTRGIEGAPKTALTKEEQGIWQKAIFNVGILYRDLNDHDRAMTYFRSLQEFRYGLKSDRAIGNLYCAQHVYWSWRLAAKDAGNPENRNTVANAALTDAIKALNLIPENRDEEFFGSSEWNREFWRQFLIRWDAEARQVVRRADPNGFGN